MYAQLECGIGKQYQDPSEMYELLEKKFKFENYAAVQYEYSPGTIHPCMTKGHPESPKNLIAYFKAASGSWNTTSSTTGAGGLALSLLASLAALCLY